MKLRSLFALKLLRKAIRNEGSFQKRLQSESRAIASLNHPNIIRPIASGAYKGTAFLAMQLIDGVGLDFACYGDHVMTIDLKPDQKTKTHMLPDDGARGICKLPNTEAIIVTTPKALYRLKNGQLNELYAADTIGETLAVSSVSTNGRMLIAAHNNHFISVMDLQNQETKTLSGHLQEITHLEILKQGRTLMTCSFDETIRFWDLEAAREVGKLEFDHGVPSHVYFFPKQSTVIATRRVGPVSAWHFSRN